MSASLQDLRIRHEPFFVRAKRALVPLFLSGLVAASWSSAWYFTANAPGLPASVSIGDRADILFGAASLALFVFSMVVSLVAILGWKAIQEIIQESVAKQTQVSLEKLEREMRGRVQTGLGFMIGEMSTKPSSIKPTDPDRLAHAVELCQAGNKQLKGLGERLELLGLNNLVYYMAVEGRIDRKDFVLSSARILRDKGQELNTPRLLLTYCRAVLVYPEDDREVARAKEILLGLVKGANLQDYEKKEARLYLREIAKKEAESTSAPLSPTDLS